MKPGAGELILERLPRMQAYAWSLTRNRAAADDLVQDTIVRVLASIENFDGLNFASWSNAILRNRYIDNRRRARFQGDVAEQQTAMATAQKATQEFVVELHELLGALHKLPSKHREILIMICVDGLSYAHAAQRLSVPVGTVRSRLSRAREILMAAVDGKRGGSGSDDVHPTRSDHIPAEMMSGRV